MIERNPIGVAVGTTFLFPPVLPRKYRRRYKRKASSPMDGEKSVPRDCFSDSDETESDEIIKIRRKNVGGDVIHKADVGPTQVIDLSDDSFEVGDQKSISTSPTLKKADTADTPTHPRKKRKRERSMDDLIRQGIENMRNLECAMKKVRVKMENEKGVLEKRVEEQKAKINMDHETLHLQIQQIQTLSDRNDELQKKLDASVKLVQKYEAENTVLDKRNKKAVERALQFEKKINSLETLLNDEKQAVMQECHGCFEKFPKSEFRACNDCGHLPACGKCYKDLLKPGATCWICRKPVNGMIKLYFH